MKNNNTNLMQKQVEDFVPIGASLMPGNLLRMRQATEDEAERDRLLSIFRHASQEKLENTLDHRRSALLDHLHRGGDFAYFWTTKDKKSTWYRTDRPRPDVPASKTNWYYGVHPVSVIPPTNSRGRVVPPERVRSQLDYIAAINCVYSEFDDKDFSDGRAGVMAHVYSLNPPPSVIIDSGGGVHCYWLLSEPFILMKQSDRERAKRLQSQWVDFTGGDPGAKDLARVLRIPGTQNYKHGEPREVKFITYNIERTYTIAGLENACSNRTYNWENYQPETKPTARRPGHQIHSGHPVSDVLNRLSSWRADDYRPWCKVGLCLAELGPEGFDLWDKWSRQSAKYNDEGNAKLMAYMWSKFKPGDGLTIASLYYWARIDSPGQHYEPELTSHQKRMTDNVPVPEIVPPEESPLRLNICGVVIDKPGTLMPQHRVKKRLVCGLNCCEFCARCKAQEFRQRVLRAIDEFGFVHLLTGPVNKRRNIMRKIGAPNAFCLPPGDSVFVFNSVGQGVLFTEDNLPGLNWFTKIVMAIPDGKKKSGDMGKEAVAQKTHEAEKSGQDSPQKASGDVGHGWVRTLATNADDKERDRLYSKAFEAVKDKVISLYRVGRFEMALNMIMGEYEQLLIAHGYRVATKSEVLTWQVSRMCGWIDPYLKRYELRTTSSGTDPPGC